MEKTPFWEETYAMLCPWAEFQKTGELWDEKLTDIAVAVFDSEKLIREQRLENVKDEGDGF